MNVIDTGKQASVRVLSWLRPRVRETVRVERAARATATDLDGFQLLPGQSGGWSRTEYGEYYATSVPVYAAIKVRSEALSRAPAVVYRQGPAGERMAVGAAHPAQQLLDRVNRGTPAPTCGEPPRPT